jgi:hypothetical protein
VLGTLQGDYFVVCVLDPHEFSEGKIVPGSAFAEFRVSVFSSCRNEELMKGRYIIALLSGSLSKVKSYVYCVPAKIIVLIDIYRLTRKCPPSSQTDSSSRSAPCQPSLAAQYVLSQCAACSRAHDYHSKYHQILSTMRKRHRRSGRTMPTRSSRRVPRYD